MFARVSVIVPAHDEAARIGGLLSDLAGPVGRGEVALVVVCNGCTDATAELARGLVGATVVETPTASKSHALNLGDRRAGGIFPRLYCDADVRLDEASIEALTTALASAPGPLAVAPRVEYALEGAPWAVRLYASALLAPIIATWIDAHLVGRGLYGANGPARARFGEFPDVTADDLFFDSQFDDDEKMVVEDALSRVPIADSLGDLVRREVRVAAGNLEHRDSGAGREEGARTRLWPALARRGRVLRRWARELRIRDVMPLAVYLSVKGWARFLAIRDRRVGRATAWR